MDRNSLDLTLWASAVDDPPKDMACDDCVGIRTVSLTIFCVSREVGYSEYISFFNPRLSSPWKESFCPRENGTG
jgi:hypothetical protein